MKTDAVGEEIRRASLSFSTLRIGTAKGSSLGRNQGSDQLEMGTLGCVRSHLIYTVEKPEIKGASWGIRWETWS